MATSEKHGNDSKFSSRAMALRNSWIVYLVDIML